jgi:hypothetical protein
MAYRQGSTYVVDMFGGLARHPEVTEEGFYTVLCHEIGHHIGGTPKYSGGADRNWASTEGEADYFATLKCMRKLFEGMPNQVANEEAGIREGCEKAFTSPTEVAACIRVAMGGFSSARLSFALSGGSGQGPKIATPDPRVVQTTFESHPQAQCRLDTYYNGAICPVSANVDVSDGDPETGGVCSVKQSSSFGRRPLCWYKPTGGGGGENPPPPPPTGIAKAPLLNGQAGLSISDGNQSVRITFDVSEFSGAAGVYIEVSRPNQPFSNPNTEQQDPNALGGAGVRGMRGEFSFTPASQLSGQGTYYFRVIPLDSSGRKAVGKFSNSVTMRWQSNGGGGGGGGGTGPFPRFPRPQGSPLRLGLR